MAYTTEFFSSSIVVVGNFNPAIFTPDWLERNNLIGKDDAEVARQGAQMFVTHQATVFETECFTLQVLENQLSITSKGVLSPTLKDIAAGIFQLVSHTPVTAVGLNFMAHYKLGSQNDCFMIGDVLAPKAIWTELFPAEDRFAGLANLTIRIQHGKRGEALKSDDETRISIQSSDKVKLGVHILYNDHHAVLPDSDDGRTPAERVASIIESNWETSWQDAIRVFDGLISKALRG